ncbi:MAG: hypothetical protein ABI222_17940 [Opitutaceae bacterium]
MIEPGKVIVSGEGVAHRELKLLTIAWARANQLTLTGTEVHLPRSSYRADVVAATTRQLGAQAVTAVFECKTSRADFLRDAAPEGATRAKITALTDRLAALNRLIGEHHPDLHRGEELFPEFDCVDLRGTRHATHTAVTRALRAAQIALYEGTKFAKLARWRAANFLYLVVDAAEIVNGHEIPAGWALLVKQGDQLKGRCPPVRHDVSVEDRIALLERLAARAR